MQTTESVARQRTHPQTRPRPLRRNTVVSSPTCVTCENANYPALGEGPAAPAPASGSSASASTWPGTCWRPLIAHRPRRQPRRIRHRCLPAPAPSRRDRRHTPGIPPHLPPRTRQRFSALPLRLSGSTMPEGCGSRDQRSLEGARRMVGVAGPRVRSGEGRAVGVRAARASDHTPDGDDASDDGLGDASGPLCFPPGQSRTSRQGTTIRAAVCCTSQTLGDRRLGDDVRTTGRAPAGRFVRRLREEHPDVPPRSLRPGIAQLSISLTGAGASGRPVTDGSGRAMLRELSPPDQGVLVKSEVHRVRGRRHP
jgi:hypothetical protein